MTFDQDVATFLRHARPWLEENATIHSMLLSLAERQRRNGKPCVLLARHHDAAGNVVAAGAQFDPNRPIVLSRSEPEAARAFACAIAAAGKTLPGVVGPTPAADEFKAAWNTPARLLTNVRLFEARAVKHPPSPGGRFRSGESKDVPLLFRWYREFHAEAVPEDPKQPDEELMKDLHDGIAREQFFFWEHGGRDVCLVGSRRETARERWIAPVYTPPEQRGKGYGTALVAAVTERILAAGKKGALFTDLANPVSNGIYPKVGYEPIADFRHWRFLHN